MLLQKLKENQGKEKGGLREVERELCLSQKYIYKMHEICSPYSKNLKRKYNFNMLTNS